MRKITIISLLIIAFGVMSVTGCKHYQAKPKWNETLPVSCNLFMDCMYRNKQNPDKSVCMDFAKECRAITRMEKCQSIDKLDLRDCMMYLNQK